MEYSHSWLLPVPHVVNYQHFAHKDLSLGLILNHIYPFHTTHPNCFKIYFSILPSMPRSSMWPLSFRYSYHTFCSLSGTWGFITVFTRSHNFSLSQAKSVDSISSHPVSLARLCIQVVYSLKFSDQNFVCISLLSCVCYRPPISSIWSL
jgi:hypothetical protein